MARRIDMAFTDLLAASVRLLPGLAPFASRDELAEVTAAARASADLGRWPQPCLDLLAACEAVLAGELDALRAGEIGRAASAPWPPPLCLASWRHRRDCGDGPELEQVA